MSQAGIISESGGGGGGVSEFVVQTGTSPVVPSSGIVTFNGAVVAAGTNPVRTDGTAAATMTVEVQTTQAIASTDATKIGLAAFNSADFTVDANGFVSTKLNSSSTTLVQTTPYTVLPTDEVLLVDVVTINAPSTILLPDSPTIDGQTWTITDFAGNILINTNTITVTTVSGITTINQATTFVLSNVFESITVVWSSALSEYNIISEVQPSLINIPNSTPTDGQYQIAGSAFVHNFGGTFLGNNAGNFTSTNYPYNNVGIGNNAVESVTTAINLTGVGANTLQYLTTGDGNTAVGTGAMFNQVSGNSNVAVGDYSLESNNSNNNTSIGSSALNASTNDSDNTAVGVDSISSLDGGSFNVATGSNSFANLLTGSYNVGSGYNIGSNYVAAESSNIIFNSSGVANENNVLRIGGGTGTGNQQLNQAFISGINGNSSISNPMMVVIDSNSGDPNYDQLGVMAVPLAPSTTYVTTTPYTALLTDDVILVDTTAIGSPAVVLLPDTPPVDGQSWTIKDYKCTSNINTNTITVTTVSGVTTIDQQLTYFIDNTSQSVTVVWDSHTSKYFVTSEVQPAIVNIPPTTATTGQYKIGGLAYLHAYSGTFVGESAGNFTSTGLYNIGVGSNSLNAVTSGESLVAIGTDALTSVTDGYGNTAIGAFAGAAQVHGYDMVAIGTYALATDTGNNNTGIGAYSLYTSAADSDNTGLGQSSLSVLNGGSFNVASGSNSFLNLLTGSYNVGAGYNCGLSYVGAESSNILFNSNGVASENNVLRIGNATGTGNQELNSAYIQGIYGNSQPVSGTVNIVTIDNTTGLLGVTSSGSSSITIDGDTGSASGSTISLLALDGGNNCGTSVDFSASGSTVVLNVTDANHNTVIGNLSGNISTPISGLYNTSLGSSSLQVETTGSQNSLLGAKVMPLAVTGDNNVAVGYLSLNAATNPFYNTSVGTLTLSSLLTGSYNTAIGYQSGNNLTGSESGNVYVNSQGVVADSHVLRIGDSNGTGFNGINEAYIAGIVGNTVGSAVMVVIDSSTNQLGVQSIPSGTFSWSDKSTSFSASAANGYVITGSTVTATLPASGTVGDTISFMVDVSGAGNLIIQASGSQVIRIGSNASSAAGTATNINQGDTITLVYSDSTGSWIQNAMTGTWMLA